MGEVCNAVDFADAVETEGQGAQSHQEEGGQEGSQGRGRQIYWHQDAQASVHRKERNWKDRQEINLLYVLAHIYTHVLQVISWIYNKYSHHTFGILIPLQNIVKSFGFLLLQ